MGLHQKIIDRTESEPCDCPADDDHSATPSGSVHELTDADLSMISFATEMRVAEADWTDGTEADE